MHFDHPLLHCSPACLSCAVCVQKKGREATLDEWAQKRQERLAGETLGEHLARQILGRTRRGLSSDGVCNVNYDGVWELLGCSEEEFEQHIRSTWVSGMSENNYGATRALKSGLRS